MSINFVLTGTVAVTNGLKTVVGTGTFWTALNVKNGDTIAILDGAVYSEYWVDSLDEGTQTITLVQDYAGATDASTSYAIKPTSPDWVNNLTISQHLIEVLAAIDAQTTALGDIPDRLPAADNANPGKLLLPEALANGVSKITIQAAGSLTADRTIILPDIDYTDAMDLLQRWTRATSAGPSKLKFFEDTDNGTNSLTVQAPATLTADRTLTWPDADMTFSTFMAGLMNNANAAALLAAIGAQPSDADLTAIAALVTTTFGRALLTTTTRGDVLTTSGIAVDLGSVADDSAASINLGTLTEGATIILQANVNTSIIFSSRTAATATGCLLVAKTTTGYTVSMPNFSAFYSGTTGTDGQLNIGAHTSGVLSIENRIGSPLNFVAYIFKLH